MRDLLKKFNKGLINKPQIGDKFIFLDDGKWGQSRRHIAFITRVLGFNDCDNIIKAVQCENEVGEIIKEHINLRDAIQNNINNDVKYQPIYTKTPDKVIECYIPSYDENLIYFIKTYDNKGWFSCDIESFWQSGRLISYDELDKQFSEDDPTLSLEDNFVERYNSEYLVQLVLKGILSVIQIES